MVVCQRNATHLPPPSKRGPAEWRKQCVRCRKWVCSQCVAEKVRGKRVICLSCQRPRQERLPDGYAETKTKEEMHEQEPADCPKLVLAGNLEAFARAQRMAAHLTGDAAGHYRWNTMVEIARGAARIHTAMMHPQPVCPF